MDLRRVVILIMCGVLGAVSGAVGAPRPLEADDFNRMQEVDNLACSSDGRWIVYTVEGADLDADERKGSVWMVNWEGTENWRLTAPAESVSAPRFSPAGHVSFLAQRGSDAKAQIYMLDRRGGDAQALTHVTGDIAGYDWSPDGNRVVISMSPGQGDTPKVPKPIVIDRLHFKWDVSGYVTAADRTQLYLLDRTTGKLEVLTNDAPFDDTKPVWSPDGGLIAFIGNRDSDPDRSGMQELYVIQARPGARPRKLAQFFTANKTSLIWSRDGARIVYTVGAEPKLNAYIQDRLAVVDVSSGVSRPFTTGLDRAVSSPALTAHDGTVAAILEDDRSEVPVEVRVDSGAIVRRLPGSLSTTSLCTGGGRVAVVAATDRSAPEVYALEKNRLRKLTGHNDALLTDLQLGAVDDISFPSRDGTMINGMLVKPADFHPGRKYPALLWIHGGPNGQDSHGLNFGTYPLAMERQWFAAQGYVVLAINYRGSSGRGMNFASSIAADWGHKEVEDLLAGVDHLIQENVADPQRLGVGGWSYGGILTDYTIASDLRFKAAVSGAGSANQLSTYGSDQYVLQYSAELGAPWAETERWLKLSYPFFHADRIKTPTLFLGGEKDFNVPIAGGEQMYEALRVQGISTQLIIYPGQFHLFTRPTYIKDRLERYAAWYGRYLAPADHAR